MAQIILFPGRKLVCWPNALCSKYKTGSFFTLIINVGLRRRGELWTVTLGVNNFEKMFCSSTFIFLVELRAQVCNFEVHIFLRNANMAFACSSGSSINYVTRNI